MQNNNPDNDRLIGRLLYIINILLLIIGVLVIAIIAMPFILQQNKEAAEKILHVKNTTADADTTRYWAPADIAAVTDSDLKKQIELGKDLVAHTAKYFGPRGTISKSTNGMNCQNCHLQAGTAVYGNNFGSVSSLYPKFRPRSGTLESAYKKIADCFERSLNGRSPDSSSAEMRSILAYIGYIGSNVSKGKKAAGSGLKEVPFLDRAADPVKGQAIFSSKCQSCHQPNGGGLYNADSTEFIYPPLWGNSSFNDAAGLYRIGNFTRYIRSNMPMGATFKNPALTDEEAWDVAAFVLSQQRPHVVKTNDWPDIALKPVDHPFGPFKDSFSEKQHKYGPFGPMQKVQKQK